MPDRGRVMVALSKVAASFATVLQLLPSKRHEHAYDDEHCDPPACAIPGCGRTQAPTLRERFRDWRDSMHDIFDCGD